MQAYGLIFLIYADIMLYNNEHIPNPFELILEQLYCLERKVDKLIKEKEADKAIDPDDQLLTVQSATAFLRIAPSTLYQLTSRHEIPFMKRGKRLYFNKEELRQWVEEGRNKPASALEQQTQLQSYLRPVKRRKLR